MMNSFDFECSWEALKLNLSPSLTKKWKMVIINGEFFLILLQQDLWWTFGELRLGLVEIMVTAKPTIIVG